MNLSTTVFLHSLRNINQKAQITLMLYAKTIKLTIKSQGFEDITSRVDDIIRNSGASSGLCNVFATGSTCAVMINENEPMLLQDINDVLERIAPNEEIYNHSENAHSHIRAALLGSSKCVPIAEGKMALGTWQKIMVGNFDTTEREREIIVTVVSENE